MTMETVLCLLFFNSTGDKRTCIGATGDTDYVTLLYKLRNVQKCIEQWLREEDNNPNMEGYTHGPETNLYNDHY